MTIIIYEFIQHFILILVLSLNHALSRIDMLELLSSMALVAALA